MHLFVKVAVYIMALLLKKMAALDRILFGLQMKHYPSILIIGLINHAGISSCHFL